jgi:drug/metabolite transporter (DMT)-like permease
MKPGLVATFRQFSAAVSIKGLIAVAVWGASFVATRMALATLNPLGLVAARLLMGAALLALVIRARGGRLWPVRRDVPACVFLGVILSVHLLMQAYGLRYTPAIQTGWIIGFIPVTIALGAWLTRQQRLSALGWSGVALGTAGVLIVTLAKSQDFALAHWGNLLQVASCLTWTVYTLTATGPNARNGVLCVTTFGMAVAAGIAAWRPSGLARGAARPLLLRSARSCSWGSSAAASHTTCGSRPSAIMGRRALDRCCMSSRSLPS